MMIEGQPHWCFSARSSFPAGFASYPQLQQKNEDKVQVDHDDHQGDDLGDHKGDDIYAESRGYNSEYGDLRFQVAGGESLGRWR